MCRSLTKLQYNSVAYRCVQSSLAQRNSSGYIQYVLVGSIYLNSFKNLFLNLLDDQCIFRLWLRPNFNQTPRFNCGSGILNVRGCRALTAYKALFSNPLCPQFPGEHTHKHRHTCQVSGTHTHTRTQTSSYSTRGSHRPHTVITPGIQKESDTIGTQKHLIFI